MKILKIDDTIVNRRKGDDIDAPEEQDTFHDRACDIIMQQIELLAAETGHPSVPRYVARRRALQFFCGSVWNATMHTLTTTGEIVLTTDAPSPTGRNRKCQGFRINPTALIRTQS